MPVALKDFFQFRDELSTVDGVILYKDRIVCYEMDLKQVFRSASVLCFYVIVPNLTPGL